MKCGHCHGDHETVAEVLRGQSGEDGPSGSCPEAQRLRIHLRGSATGNRCGKPEEPKARIGTTRSTFRSARGRTNGWRRSEREIVALNRMAPQVISCISSKVRTTLTADLRHTVRPGSADANAGGRRVPGQLMLSGRATLITAPLVLRFGFSGGHDTQGVTVSRM